MPAARPPFLVGAALGLAAVVAATGGPAVRTADTGYTAAEQAANAAAARANGPSADHLFRLEAAPRQTRESALALAAAPAAVDPAAFNAAALAAASRLPRAGANLTWTQVGRGGGVKEDPARGANNDGRLKVTGIVLSLASDPRDVQATTVYAGTGGGLWKTTDGGSSWTQMAIPAVPVGGVGVDPSDPDLVVAATGQAFQGGGDGGGFGVYVSRDAGRSWTRPARNVPGNGGQQVSFSPAGSVFVATDRGLSRSVDHGASFTDVLLPTNAAGTGPATGTPVGSWTTDVQVRPGSPAEVFAAVGYVAGKVKLPDGSVAAPGNGLYRSGQGGAPGTWRRVDISSPTTGWTQNPTGSSDPIGRTRLAFTPDGASLLALVADAGLRSARSVDDMAIPLGLAHDTSLNGLYRTDDPAGATPTWSLKANSQSLTAAPGGAQPVLSALNGLGFNPGIQAWYNGWLAVDPVTPTRVFLGEEETYVSTGGTAGPGLATFAVVDRYFSPCALVTSAACPPGTPIYGGLSTHPDQHAGLPLRTASGTRLYAGNDGGIFRQDSHPTTDGAGFDDEHWTSGAQLNTLLPYKAVKGTDGSVVAGLQDNGTAKNFPGEKDAVAICGGDGSGVAIARRTPRTFYCQANGSVSVTTDGGKTTSDAGAPVAPAFKPDVFQMDPTDDNHLLIGDGTVYETTKGAASRAETAPGTGDGDWKAVFTNPGPNATSTTPSPVLSLDVSGPHVYEAYCTLCSSSVKAAIGKTDRGLATNVKPGCTPHPGTADCWHVARLAGMPARQPQSLGIDPADPRRVYLATTIPSVVRVDFGGVDAARVLLSTDAGESVTDISGDLPRGNVWDVQVVGRRVYVATDLGVFVAPLAGRTWSAVGRGLPVVRTFGLSVSGSRKELVAATYGAGVWTIPLLTDASPAAKGAAPPPPAAPRPGLPRAGGRLAATGAPVGLAVLGALLLLAGTGLRRRRT